MSKVAKITMAVEALPCTSAALDACRQSCEILPSRRTGVQVVEMQYAADLADPLVDVRDVVENFRSSHLTLPDWDQTPRRVITALSRLS